METTPGKTLMAIPKMSKGETRVNGRDNKEFDNEEQGFTSKR